MTAVENAVKNEIGNTDQSQRYQVSSERNQEEEDESYIPVQPHRESDQLRSDRNS